MSAEIEPTIEYETVDARPVKSFFVSMLTRDIDLSDAILDLLDNCVDGILRSKRSKRRTNPYKNYCAEIEFDQSSFSIHDNCGGIPWELKDYAYRMGRRDRPGDRTLGTVGTYGIGMKRAIFKIGKECLISTQSGEQGYEVGISEEWLQNQDNWDLPVNAAAKSMKEDGTTIVICQLYPNISTQFGANRASFASDFVKQIAGHYAFIINKGFDVRVNGVSVRPKPIKLVFSDGEDGKHGIKPFIYKATVDDVEVFLAVGFTRPIPSQDDITAEQEEIKYSSSDAGWTVICNDRAVLYCDKSELTGWGEAGVPKYHTQFTAIAGLVEFRSNDPAKLPTTTTKRGIDASSALFLQVKNKMREGISLFTGYTNRWKNDSAKSKSHMKKGKSYTLEEIKQKSAALKFNTVKKGLLGEQYKPALPKPRPKELDRKRISYYRDADDIQLVGEYLVVGSETSPSHIGEACFDEIMRKVKK